ncbi:MAG TPA: cupin domain-containing protein [Holophagaceae bacterium]|nr:cupin domain-containing protein [Holophagaceae bacterium]
MHMARLGVDLQARVLDEVPRIRVGPGCYRQDLPSSEGVRVWVVEMAPGAQWPGVDFHDLGEEVFVLSGELIEGQQRFEAGTYLHFAPGSSHQPWTEEGVRLFGVNVDEREEA